MITQHLLQNQYNTLVEQFDTAVSSYTTQVQNNTLSTGSNSYTIASDLITQINRDLGQVDTTFQSITNNDILASDMQGLIATNARRVADLQSIINAKQRVLAFDDADRRRSVFLIRGAKILVASFTIVVGVVLLTLLINSVTGKGPGKMTGAYAM
jgi:hypothetical protein